MHVSRPAEALTEPVGTSGQDGYNHAVRGKAVIAGIVLLLMSGVLMTADYTLKEEPHQRELMAGASSSAVPEPVAASSSSVSSAVSGAVSSADPSVSSSAGVSSSPTGTRVVKKGSSTKKSAGVNVQEVFGKLQLIPKDTGEAGFLFFLVKDRSKVKTVVLLKLNDRAFLFSWMEDDNAKEMFSGLKQALSEQFSGKVQDLLDETRLPDSGPPVDVLSFYDPGLSPEKITFLRVRTRLYEIHTAKNGEDMLDALVAELSR